MLAEDNLVVGMGVLRENPYKEYSEPWFRTPKVLRGGAWATRGRMLRNTWRNFFTPQRLAPIVEPKREEQAWRALLAEC